MSAPFVIERTYDAPRERMWRVWTQAEHLKNWWGPQGFKVHTCKVDLRPGGMFHYGMTAPDGSDLWGRFIYREIAPPVRLAFIVSFSDPEGGITRNPWNAHWPLQTHSVVTFSELAPGRTKVTVQWTPHEAGDVERKAFEDGKPSMQQGWGGTLQQLADFLKQTLS